MIITKPACNSNNYPSVKKSPLTTTSYCQKTGDIVTPRVSKKVSKVVTSGKLGSITKFQSNSKNKNSKTLIDHRSNRRETYSLMKTSAKLLPDFRVDDCLNKRITKERGVGVKLNTNNGRASFNNLIRCDSLWVCPCCSGRILAHRGKEVEQGVKNWTEGGGSVFMLTLTHSHKKKDDLSEKMKLLRKALSRFFGDRVMKSLFERIGKVGQIKALETTYSNANGWHPHHHILFFSEMSPSEFKNMVLPVGRTYKKNRTILSDKKVKRLIEKGEENKIDYMTVEKFIKFYWVKICKDVGLGLPTLKHGAKLEDASAVKTYLTKFKTAQELTNAKVKKAKGESRNQWEILADAHKGDTHSEKLWQEYAKAFKGEQQLRWSDKLKELTGIDEIEDSEIKENGEVSEEEILDICEISFSSWRFIVKKGWQPHLLEVVEDDFANETNNLEIFLFSVAKQVEKQKAIWEARERERIAKLVPPKWWEDHHNIDR